MAETSTKNGTGRLVGAASAERRIRGEEIHRRSERRHNTTQRDFQFPYVVSFVEKSRAGPTAVAQALVTTKLHPPRTRPKLVTRPRLREEP